MFIEPVFGKKFFGREEVLGTLNKRVTALKGGYRQNLALTGPMLTGKSSVLRHFLSNINDPDVIPIYIEMGDDSFNVFCKRFMATLLYRYLWSIGLKPGDDLNSLIFMSRFEIPDTVKMIEKISSCLKTKKINRAYDKLLALTSLFKEETHKNCIVILDEFHNLSNFKLKKPFQVFGKYIMIQKNTMYIVSSSQKTLLKDILRKKLSLLFGNFEMIDINGFDNHTALSFIADKLRDIETESLPVVKSYLIQLSQGNPFYLEMLINRFKEIYEGENNFNDPKECLLETLARVVYASDGILNQYFVNNVNFFLEKTSRKRYIAIIEAIAAGKCTIKKILSEIGKSDKSISGKLKTLQEMDLIYNSGVFYKISDKLFEFWVKNVYTLKKKSFIDDMDIKYLEFKKNIEDDYDDYSRFYSKNVLTIISDVFKAFNNEKIRIEMNDRKMPDFDNVETTEISKSLAQITAQIKNKKWICRVKQFDIATYQDIYDLWKAKTGSKKNNITRKIIIPLNGIEHNAYLLAKEQNVWVWDIKQLNEILRLFKKYELVI